MDFIKISLCLIFIFGLFHEYDCQMLEGNGSSLPHKGICYSTDIRNLPENFMKLRNCTVILGALQIVLIEQVHDYSNFTFPELREITQYLLIYRITSLLSLGKLFPNLTLIRGQKLILNHALIIYEMPQLQEIGLRSLKVIRRGFVRVERNPQMCFDQTVNWQLITGKTEGNHFFENGNSFCPASESCRGCDGYCWSSRHCQKFSSSNCHPECLGGCNRKGLCYRCKHFTDDGVCVPSCPPGKFIMPEALICVTKEFCSTAFNNTGWTFGNRCITSCPIGYKYVENDGVKNCSYCGDKCVVVCTSEVIQFLENAQTYKGCNYVNGSLQIQILGEFKDDKEVMKELEFNLGMIKEITGYLRIYRSNSITSLNFLKNLTVIHGKELLNGRYALAVHDMSSLQSTWNWTSKQNLSIKRGTLFFHQNARLCYKEIVKLANLTNTTIEQHGVCNTSNGYKVFCQETKLSTEIKSIGKKNAVISWERIVRSLKRNGSLLDRESLGYLIHYMPTTDDNVKSHHGIDSCNRGGWNVLFFPEPVNSIPSSLTLNLTKLIPYTKYAFYVQTYNVNENKSVLGFEDGQSDVMLFKTKMETPPMPRHVEAISYTDDSITLYWKKPEKYNGVVAYYTVEMYFEPDDQESFDKSNFCKRKINRELVTAKRKFGENDVQKYDEECVCLVKNPQSGDAELYFKTIRNEFNIHEVLDLEKKYVRTVRKNITHNGKYHAFTTEVSADSKNFTINNLKHFGKYVISIAGCIRNNDAECGIAAITRQRTLKNPSVDRINKMTAVVSNPNVEFSWEEPNEPNGIVLSYVLQYKRTDLDNFMPLVICITRLEHEKNKGKYVLQNVTLGSYAVRIKVISLGHEEYTDWYEFFVVEELPIIIVLSLLGACLVVTAAISYWVYSRRAMNVEDDRDALLTPEVFHPTVGVRFMQTKCKEEVEFYDTN